MQAPEPQFPNTPTDTPTLADSGGIPTQPTPLALPSSPPGYLPGYDVIEEIAHGGMGIVFKARQLGLDRIVALKVMIAGEHATAEMLERFQREAKAAARLQHPNIVQIYDVGAHGAKHYFTMRYVDGPSLSIRIQRKEVSPRRALEVVRRVALALDYAHAHGVVHRDVKPANILIDSSGEPHLADFGLAKDLSCEGLTVPGASLGTPNYASPEQGAGDTEKVDARSDVYSLGASLYEALTGRPPFTGESMFAVLKAVMTQDPEPPRRVNPNIQRDIETICLKAMQKDRARRYQTAGEMAEDIGRYLEGEPIHARPVSWLERTVRRASKNRAVLLPAAVALAAVLAFCGWLGVTSMNAQRRVREEVRLAAQEERQADGLPSRDARRERYAKARDLLVGALKLDQGNRAVKEALDRVSGRLDAIASEEVAERDTATKKAASAEEALRKSQLVSKVFARWSRLTPTLQKMESLHYDSRLAEAARNEAVAKEWPPVEEFLKETPDDTASKATAMALASWAKRLAGDVDAARREMHQAAALDPDLPYGALMEALDIFAQVIENQAWPSITIGPTGIEIGQPRGGVTNLAEGQARMAELLQKARAARVWGKEGAEDFTACIEGILAVQARDWVKAEESLSRAHSAPDLSAFESGILFTRARVRYMRKEFDGALADLDGVARARPSQAGVFQQRGVVRFAMAVETGWRGKDSREQIRQTLGELDAGLALVPGDSRLLVSRGNAWVTMGQSEASHGLDPRSSYDRAKSDFDHALERDARQDDALVDRANVLLDLAEWDKEHGQDPSAAYEQAIAGYTAALALTPDSVETYCNRGNAYEDKADWADIRGADPRELLKAAISDLGEALTRRPEFAPGYNSRATAWNALGMAEAARGGDPRASYEKGLVDLLHAVSISPEYVQAWGNCGRLRTNLGQWEALHGIDPTEAYTKAIEDLGRASSINPSFAQAWNAQSATWRLLGQWEASQGKDPRSTYDKGIEAVEEALKRNPDLVDAYNNRGLLRLSRAEWENDQHVDSRGTLATAIADFDEVLRRNPSALNALCNRGTCQARKAEAEKAAGADPQSSLDGALADFRASLKLNPSSWQVHQCLGSVFEMRGENEKALEEYQRAFAIVGDAIPPLTESLKRIRQKLGK